MTSTICRQQLGQSISHTTPTVYQAATNHNTERSLHSLITFHQYSGGLHQPLSLLLSHSEAHRYSHPSEFSAPTPTLTCPTPVYDPHISPSVRESRSSSSPKNYRYHGQQPNDNAGYSSGDSDDIENATVRSGLKEHNKKIHLLDKHLAKLEPTTEAGTLMGRQSLDQEKPVTERKEQLDLTLQADGPIAAKSGLYPQGVLTETVKEDSHFHKDQEEMDTPKRDVKGKAPDPSLRILAPLSRKHSRPNLKEHSGDDPTGTRQNVRTRNVLSNSITFGSKTRKDNSSVPIRANTIGPSINANITSESVEAATKSSKQGPLGVVPYHDDKRKNSILSSSRHNKHKGTHEGDRTLKIPPVEYFLDSYIEGASLRDGLSNDDFLLDQSISEQVKQERPPTPYLLPSMQTPPALGRIKIDQPDEGNPPPQNRPWTNLFFFIQKAGRIVIDPNKPYRYPIGGWRDEDLINYIKKEYRAMRQWNSLKELGFVYFLKVDAHEARVLDKKPVMEYKGPDTNARFINLLRHPPPQVRRWVTKLDDLATGNQKVVLMIQGVEILDKIRLFGLLILSILFSALIAIFYSIFQRDVSGAFTIASYVVTCLSLILAALALMVGAGLETFSPSAGVDELQKGQEVAAGMIGSQVMGGDGKVQVYVEPPEHARTVHELEVEDYNSVLGIKNLRHAEILGGSTLFELEG